MPGPKPIAPEIRFLAKVKVRGEDECWPWLGSRQRDNYGAFAITARNKIAAHRFSYQMHVGAIPPNSDVMHSCDNPICVNPRHLSVGSRKENMQDAVRKGRVKHGSGHHGAKLTEVDVLKIKLALRDRERGTTMRLAREYGVSHCTISDIHRGRYWRRVA